MLGIRARYGSGGMFMIDMQGTPALATASSSSRTMAPSLLIRSASTGRHTRCTSCPASAILVPRSEPYEAPRIRILYGMLIDQLLPPSVSIHGWMIQSCEYWGFASTGQQSLFGGNCLSRAPGEVCIYCDSLRTRRMTGSGRRAGEPFAVDPLVGLRAHLERRIGRAPARHVEPEPKQ